MALPGEEDWTEPLIPVGMGLWQIAMARAYWNQKYKLLLIENQSLRQLVEELGKKLEREVK